MKIKIKMSDIKVVVSGTVEEMRYAFLYIDSIGKEKDQQDIQLETQIKNTEVPQIEEKVKSKRNRAILLSDYCLSCKKEIYYPSHCSYCDTCAHLAPSGTEAHRLYQQEYYSRGRINKLLSEGVDLEAIRNNTYR